MEYNWTPRISQYSSFYRIYDELSDSTNQKWKQT